MNELVKALGRFFTRDAVFVFGGSLVLAATWLRLGLGVPQPIEPVYYVVGGGAAYVVGFAIQELATIGHLVITAHEFDPPRFYCWLFRLHQREAWTRGDQSWHRFDRYAAIRLVEAAPEFVRAEYDRVVVLKQVGSTVGPCLIVCAFILCLPSDLLGSQTNWAAREPLPWAAFVVLLVGLLLICASWIKAMQQRRLLVGLVAESQKAT